MGFFEQFDKQHARDNLLNGQAGQVRRPSESRGRSTAV
jgi:hypothetical protein